ncbi:hypothetical protein PSACC_02071 [Paramicrosporidium saccamoebae]|uniref:Uncharacterized protein n=1 Tax=Paramicrosporidium saccamoebae TaxID=1246581 RepID=A0A2H9TK39_9FUNG|nr:hypothetical protein PSACC_02071 [Paramicrosporidium saccamoebae]
MGTEKRPTRRNSQGASTLPDLERENRDQLREVSVSPVRSASPSPGRHSKHSAFKQQRLPAWQPILTPYNVIPSLFVMAFVFIPLGVVFLIFSEQVQEYMFDYTTCLAEAPIGKFVSAPSGYGNVPFEWRRLSSIPTYAPRVSDEFSPAYMDAANLCEVRFKVEKEISGPVFQYYRLSNYYQNQRLYVKSVDWHQLKGQAVERADLEDCAPLQGDSIDTVYAFPPKDIAWPYDKNRYGVSEYKLEEIRPPPFWVKDKSLVNSDGTYKKIPNLSEDERFQNWMKVAGLPTFRKPYGRCTEDIPPGFYTVLISSTYEVESYGAKKAFVISNTSWIGGKNTFLGYAYIVAGTVFLALAIVFLARHLVAPRRLGDASFLSWNQEAAPITAVQ